MKDRTTAAISSERTSMPRRAGNLVESMVCFDDP